LEKKKERQAPFYRAKDFLCSVVGQRKGENRGYPLGKKEKKKGDICVKDFKTFQKKNAPASIPHAGRMMGQRIS